MSIAPLNARHVFLFVAILSSIYPTRIVAQQETDQKATHVKRLRALVRFLESELETASDLLKNQAGSKAEVDQARAHLAMARHDLALAEDNRDEVSLQCRQLIEIRNQQLQRQVDMSKLGFGSNLKMSMAIRRLACSRYQLAILEKKTKDAFDQLNLIVRCCKDELTHLTKLQTDGAVSVMELNRARHRATIAEHRLANAEGAPASVIPKLRKSVELCQQEFDQINRLRQQGFADVIDEYSAHNHVLNARLLLANLEKEHAAAKDLLDDLIRVHEKTLPRLDTDREGRRARLLIERELARDRGRKAQYIRDGYLEDDLSVAEIGS